MTSRRKKPSREELVSAVISATRRSATSAVLFHSAIAAQFDLTATDTRTLELLDRLGPQTAGSIAAHTGLVATSVTSLIDRLQVRGLVRRVSDASDRRKVVVERVPEAAGRMNAPYASIAKSTMTLIAKYSDDELIAIADFLSRGADFAQAAIAKLEQQPSADPKKSTRSRPSRPRTAK